MPNDRVPWEGYGQARKRIVFAYEHMRHLPSDRESLTKKIAKQLGYTINSNNSNSFVARVIREYRQKRK